MLPGGRGAMSRGRGGTCCDGDADRASTPKNPGGEIVGGTRFFFGAGFFDLLFIPEGEVT